jgi:Kef-type K+ transport system membrane component KefB
VLVATFKLVYTIITFLAVVYFANLLSKFVVPVVLDKVYVLLCAVIAAYTYITISPHLFRNKGPRNRESFLLVVVSICLLMALITDLLDLSLGIDYVKKFSSL